MPPEGVCFILIIYRGGRLIGEPGEEDAEVTTGETISIKTQ